jgi:hypothetical protein
MAKSSGRSSRRNNLKNVGSWKKIIKIEEVVI